MIRLLLPLGPGVPQTVDVEGDRFHHLVRVLRLAEGDTLEVFDGRGRAFPARVQSVREDRAVLELGPVRAEAAMRRALTLIQALPKADKLEWILQKGTELGATAFLPVESARSVVRLARIDEKVRRWSKIVEEAARQCGRSDVPAVLEPRPLTQALSALAPGTRVLVLDEEEKALRLSTALARGSTSSAGLALVVGPEGGLARSEVEALTALGATPVTLGRRILRTETASVAALSVVLHLEGELG